ncbi:MAG: type I DNA topoisomerase [Planctomycetes bacterium]|nr:type I DNA topoisomerase [Planctomycetota bacterium]
MLPPMKLVIVESPNKTRKIREFLGSGYRVAASFGHVRDLPASGELSVGFAAGRVLPTYVPLERSRQAIADLTRQAADADEVLLATDPDREGEAIAWHISQLLGTRAYRRVVFHSITRAEVLKAVASPRDLDLHLVDAQQARRVLDRVVGWLVSPTLRRLGKDARSAGRVQSVALRLVAEREREIQKFNAVDYFILAARLERPGTPPPFQARLVAWKGEPLAQRLADAKVADQTVAWCRRQEWRVQGCERREQQRHPPAPFTTATVQQAASVRLGLNPDATMKLLQGLFEDGRITYHRTDSTALAPEAIAAARALIARDFPKAYLPAQAVVHATKAANAQEAHEAIRPTHPEEGVDAAGSEAADKLYRLIWQRFIACQMAPGRDQLTTLDVACAPGAWLVAGRPPQPMGVFQAKGKVVLFDGWRRLTSDDATEERAVRKRKAKAGAPAKPGGDEEDEFAGELPMLQPGDALNLLELDAQARTTKPPSRYTQASLIKKLEHDGIGRPSTYAAIMRTIIERAYVAEKQRKLHATELGLAVTDFLVRHFSGNFIDLGYTARLEGDLDRIARGETGWERVVTEASHAVLAMAQRAGLRGNPLAPAGAG